MKRYLLKCVLLVTVCSLLLPTAKSLPEPDEDQYYFQRIPIEEWTGEKFIFCSKPVSLQKFDYPQIFRMDAEGNLIKNSNPSYSDCAGRSLTVLDVSRTAKGHEVSLQMDTGGDIYKAITGTGTIDGIVSVSDLERARDAFAGREFYYLRENLISYNEQNNSYIPVYAEQFSRLKVVDIKPGWSATKPIRLVLETPHDQEGYVDINLSGTNVPPSFIANDSFFTYFSTENPSRWDDQARSMIDRGMISPGMTRPQAILSWGLPLNIKTGSDGNSVLEEWLYPYDDVLIFENGKLLKKVKSR